MGFLEGETEDDSDEFLGEIEDTSGGFLDGIDDKEQVSKPPHPYALPNDELMDEYWQDEWNNITDEVRESSSNMKVMPCPECGYETCVAKRSRSVECKECGSYNVDLNWEDSRIEH